MGQVIAFPERPIPPLVADLRCEDVCRLLAAFSVLGEPARAQEITDLFDCCLPPSGAPLSSDQVAALLTEGSAKGLYRPVSLAGAEAWGLTPASRATLRSVGIAPRLRRADP